jgi:hypothetical protein
MIRPRDTEARRTYIGVVKDGVSVMKKYLAAAAVLLASGSAAYAAAPGTLHAIAQACGLPCC